MEGGDGGGGVTEIARKTPTTGFDIAMATYAITGTAKVSTARSVHFSATTAVLIVPTASRGTCGAPIGVARVVQKWQDGVQAQPTDTNLESGGIIMQSVNSGRDRWLIMVAMWYDSVAYLTDPGALGGDCLTSLAVAPHKPDRGGDDGKTRHGEYCVGIDHTYHLSDESDRENHASTIFNECHNRTTVFVGMQSNRHRRKREG